MRFERYDCSRGCPVEATLEKIGGKWKGIVLYHLLDGPKRYNELMRNVGGVTQRMLTKQLRELEDDGLILRKVFPVVPPHVEYSLTELGQSLIPLLYEMHQWAQKNADKLPAPKARGER